MKRQKQLAIFLPGLYGGGAERTMLSLAHGIAGRGYGVDLVLVQAEGPYLKEIPNSVRLVDLGQGRIVNRNRTLRRLPALVRYLRREQPDVVLSALRRTNIMALWARRMAGVPNRVVINEQSNVSEESSNHPNRLLSRLFFSLAKYCYPWADNAIGVSQGVVDDLVQELGIPQQLTKVIHNPGITPELCAKARVPLDHPWFQPKPEGSGEGSLPPVLLAVGRFEEQKDFPTLLNAFARLRQARAARLLILGEGPERPKLEALAVQLGIEKDVSLPGFVKNPYPYMVRASVFVMSSRWEGLPTVLIEALYCGAPIVSTDCPSGPREILRNGEIGRLVPMGEPMALAEAISEALDGKVARPSRGSWQPFTVETVVEQYVDVLLAEQ